MLEKLGEASIRLVLSWLSSPGTALAQDVVS
jgi:hypothetical protein